MLIMDFLIIRTIFAYISPGSAFLVLNLVFSARRPR